MRTRTSFADLNFGFLVLEFAGAVWIVGFVYPLSIHDVDGGLGSLCCAAGPIEVLLNCGQRGCHHPWGIREPQQFTPGDEFTVKTVMLALNTLGSNFKLKENLNWLDFTYRVMMVTTTLTSSSFQIYHSLKV
jgi:hypothetical protein